LFLNNLLKEITMFSIMTEWSSIFREVEHSYAAWDEYDVEWERHLKFCYGTPETLEVVLDEFVKRHGSPRLGLLQWFPLFCPRNWEEVQEILGPSGRLKEISRDNLSRLVPIVPARGYDQTIEERADELFQWSCAIETDYRLSCAVIAQPPRSYIIRKEGWELYLADLSSGECLPGETPELSKYASFMCFEFTVEILPLLADQVDLGYDVSNCIK
jgi:hypothetical protein